MTQPSNHDWIIRVLEDLQDYARLHGLGALAEHLDQARLLALTEISSLAGPDAVPLTGD